MTRDEAEAIVLDELHAVAPATANRQIAADDDLRKELDDPTRFLAFVLGVHHRARVPIDEAEYSRLLTLEDCVSYLTSGAR